MSHEELPKAYEPKMYEDHIYKIWEQSRLFNPDNLPGERTETFSMVLPPPNVTGTLHMGHAAMLAIEDVMVRFARMRGKRTLWVPGTDHAAIATQAKVEGLLRKEGMKDPRRELGREAFLARVRAFAQDSHDTIVNQCKKMGASLDWSREAYTLDETPSFAVRTVFTMMYDDGLIYRGHRVINWCPQCKSTLADDEVEYKETKANLVTFKYSKDLPMIISTTRPETKFGDVAMAVHPEDERYVQYHGQIFQVNFLGVPLSLKVITDKNVDKAFGTGVLGVTPAHSQIDAEMARANQLPSLVVIGEDGRMTAVAGVYAGLTVKEAREKAIVDLREAGLVEKEEEVSQNLSVCYRCGTAVEPMPKLQWFINVNQEFAFKASTHAPIKGLKDGDKVTLKSLMQHVVKTEQIEIIPDRFEKTYFHWVDNLRDWNISRQIWFGHRVPVWYRGEEMVVGVEAPAGEGWTQDEDTLDTWFSSGLWTMSTLGWPNKTSDFQMFHPTSVLETGYDILFFWVARMILMTTYATGEIPFKTVYLHGLVRDEQGRKMSKSLGNVINPLDMIEKYGTDATRLSLLLGNSPGNDMKLSEEKIAGFRNFTNKLWNIARFVLTTSGEVSQGTLEPKTLADRWILCRFATVVEQVTAKLEAHEFSSAGELLRDFTWGEFADWYLEIAKIQRVNGMSESTDRILLSILNNLLILWHPFMPYVTEQVWSYLGKSSLLMVEPWPVVSVEQTTGDEQSFDVLREVIVAIRNVRSQYKVEPAKDVDVILETKGQYPWLQEQVSVIQRLARVKTLQFDVPVGTSGFVSVVVGSITVHVPLAGLVDAEKEKVRLTAELEQTKSYVASTEAKLTNEAFLSKAPAPVVQSMKEKLEQARAKMAEIEKQLTQL